MLCREIVSFSHTLSRYPTTDCITDEVPTPTPTISFSPTATPTSTPDTSAASNQTCPPSNITFFTDDAKRFALGWTITWSILCFCSTLITIFTFAISTKRFEYPWRPIIFLAICFNLHSATYFLALVLGTSIVTCPGNEFFTSSVTWSWKHIPCLLVFALLYYTMMAAFLWWLVLTVGWFLAAGLKWSSEGIGRLSPLFHIISWIAPLGMTVALTAGQVILADELTGICFVVRDSNERSFYGLLIGVIIPLILFIVVGLVFLIIGLVSVCRVRSFLRHKGKDRETVVLEKLILRIGIFAGVYILPAAVLIGCFIYELQSRPLWRPVDEPCSNCIKANPIVFIVRIFMFLIIGILTGMWIWSKKTLTAWRKLLQRCLCWWRQTTSSAEEAKEAQEHPEYAADIQTDPSMQHLGAITYPADQSIQYPVGSYQDPSMQHLGAITYPTDPSVQYQGSPSMQHLGYPAPQRGSLSTMTS